MKKISLLIVLCLVFVLSSNVNLKADNDNPNYSINYVKHYFSHLNNYYLSNDTNTICPYQAFSSLIGYWDNYWDESFVQNAYQQKIDVNGHGYSLMSEICIPGNNKVLNIDYFAELMDYCESKGVDFTELGVDETELDLIIDYFSDFDYDQIINFIYGYLNYNSSTSILGKIMSTVNGNGYNESNYDTVFHMNGAQYDDTISIYNSYINYIDSTTSFNKNNYTFIYQTGATQQGQNYHYTDLSSTVINYLNDGYPVICFLYDVEPNSTHSVGAAAHAMLCYEASNGTIYGHTDYFNQNGSLVLDTHYDIADYADDVCVGGYYVITPNSSSSHAHTMAYYNSDYNGYVTYYCPCQILSHTHTMTYNSDYHYCTDDECGYYIHHQGLYAFYNDYGHYFHCEMCNQNYYEGHDYVPDGIFYICTKCHHRCRGSDVIIYKKDEEELI